MRGEPTYFDFGNTLVPLTRAKVVRIYGIRTEMTNALEKLRPTLEAKGFALSGNRIVKLPESVHPSRVPCFPDSQLPDAELVARVADHKRRMREGQDVPDAVVAAETDEEESC